MNMIPLVLIGIFCTLVSPHALPNTVIQTEKRNETVTIKIEGLGSVMGSVGKTAVNERPMYSFYGVPYGQDTSGPNRFKESKMVESWGEDLIDVTTKKPDDSCPQFSIVKFGKAKGSEDCLKLYIFSTKLPGDEGFGDLPVMVWFYGGAFIWGDMQLYRGNRLLDSEDIILVVPHYRLGTLGFMCVHTDEAPGNAGLSDQVLALEWVQKYISSFGGDPNKVVIAGESAGAASSSHLMLYDGAKDLFRGVITESGASLNAWALDDYPEKSALAYGARIGCDYTNEQLDEFVECMRQLPFETIVENWMDFMLAMQHEGLMGLNGASPVVQKAGARRIISENPLTKLQNQNFNPVPLFAGNNLHEGAFLTQMLYWFYIIPNDLRNNQEFWQNEAWSMIVDIAKIEDPDGSFADSLVEKFLPGVEITNMDSVVDGLVDMMGALFFKNGTKQVIEYVTAAGAPAYLYSFEFDIIRNVMDFFRIDYVPTVPIGVTHAMELPYLFDFMPLFTRKMDKVSEKMVKAWTNFVKYLDPTFEGDDVGIPKLTPYSDDSQQYMVISNKFSIKEDFTQTFTARMDAKAEGRDDRPDSAYRYDVPPMYPLTNVKFAEVMYSQNGDSS